MSTTGANQVIVQLTATMKAREAEGRTCSSARWSSSSSRTGESHGSAFEPEGASQSSAGLKAGAREKEVPAVGRATMFPDTARLRHL